MRENRNGEGQKQKRPLRSRIASLKAIKNVGGALRLRQ